LIDTAAAKPDLVRLQLQKQQPAQKLQKQKLPCQPKSSGPAATSGTPSPAARKILDEKNIAAALTGTGKDGRITKDDAVNAVPSMGTPTGGSRGQSAQNYQCCVVK
jgi:2-oxoglutarate dehydrogenase E2 component (dihydrolipoamide succinyltransferase)